MYFARLAACIGTWGKHPAELAGEPWKEWMMYDVIAYNMETYGSR